MRIIAGNLKGRNFNSPTGHRTHPMSDKARGGLFNVLGDITGLNVLDAFAGSGALGFEALSRGAAHVVLIDSDRNAQQAIIKNIDSLGLKECAQVVQASAGAWLRTTNNTFDILLLDPPYDNTQITLLQRLSERLSPGGIAVLSWPGRQQLPSMPSLNLVRTNSYSDNQLAFYRREL